MQIIRRAPIKEFAIALARDIELRFPPAIFSSNLPATSANRLTLVIDDVAKKAADFKKEHKLGWFGKSRLGNDFRWELLDRGYSKDFVDIATEALVVSMSREK